MSEEPWENRSRSQTFGWGKSKLNQHKIHLKIISCSSKANNMESGKGEQRELHHISCTWHLKINSKGRKAGSLIHHHSCSISYFITFMQFHQIYRDIKEMIEENTNLVKMKLHVSGEKSCSACKQSRFISHTKRHWLRRNPSRLRDGKLQIWGQVS